MTSLALTDPKDNHPILEKVGAVMDTNPLVSTSETQNAKRSEWFLLHNWVVVSAFVDSLTEFRVVLAFYRLGDLLELYSKALEAWQRHVRARLTPHEPLKKFPSFLEGSLPRGLTRKEMDVRYTKG